MIKFLISLCIVATTAVNGQVDTAHHDHEVLVNTAFNDLDADNSSSVDFQEFFVVVNQSDTNNDGCTSQQEFAVSRPNQPLLLNTLTFNMFNGNGGPCIDDSDVRTVFDGIDTDKSGSLSRPEFQEYFYAIIRQTFGQGMIG